MGILGIHAPVSQRRFPPQRQYTPLAEPTPRPTVQEITQQRRPPRRPTPHDQQRRSPRRPTPLDHCAPFRHGPLQPGGSWPPTPFRRWVPEAPHPDVPPQIFSTRPSVPPLHSITRPCALSISHGRAPAPTSPSSSLPTAKLIALLPATAWGRTTCSSSTLSPSASTPATFSPTLSCTPATRS